MCWKQINQGKGEWMDEVSQFDESNSSDDFAKFVLWIAGV